MNWALRIFKDWQRAQPGSSSTNTLKELSEYDPFELCPVLSKFVFDCRKHTGENYPPKTLYEIYAMLNYYLINEAKWTVSLFKDPIFQSARNALETRMKENAKAGLVSGGNKSLFISKNTEENMWQAGLLGSDSPSTLLNTVIFLVGVHFALRGGDELRKLRHGDLSQIQFIVDLNGQRCLMYKEDVSKARQGGIKSIAIKPKQVYAYHNEANHERCLPCVFRKYLDLRPSHISTDALFLTPVKSSWTKSQWFKNMPLGKNPLNNVVKTLMAGYEGRFTNQSLRRTAATRLFQDGISEDLIRGHTGHRSNAIMQYKEPSDEQLKNVSSSLYNVSVLNDTSSGVVLLPEEPLSVVLNSPLSSKGNMTVEQYGCGNVAQPLKVNDKIMETVAQPFKFSEKENYAPERTVIELEKNGAKLRIFM
jgi:hypothetical protein